MSASWRHFSLSDATLQVGSSTIRLTTHQSPLQDEGAAIFTVTNAPPAGRHFVTYEGLPSDYYLRLTGAATRMMRGKMPLAERISEKLAGRED